MVSGASLRPCLVCGRLSSGVCRRRRCREGRERWSWDVWAVLAAALVRAPAVLLVVVTAPGATELPWDTRLCTHRPGQRCSGVLGCRIVRHERDRWEADYAARLGRLHRAVLERCRRQGYASPLLAWVREDQQRQVIHANLVLRDGPGARLYRTATAELAARYGFGFVDQRSKSMPGERAAGYLAGYLAGPARSPKAQKHASMGDSLDRTPGRRRVWYAAIPCTKASGVTMGSLRNGRRCWAVRSGFAELELTGLAIVDWRVVDLDTGAILHHVWAREDFDQGDADVAKAVQAVAARR